MKDTKRLSVMKSSGEVEQQGEVRQGETVKSRGERESTEWLKVKYLGRGKRKD